MRENKVGTLHVLFYCHKKRNELTKLDIQKMNTTQLNWDEWTISFFC